MTAAQTTVIQGTYHTMASTQTTSKSPRASSRGKQADPSKRPVLTSHELNDIFNVEGLSERYLTEQKRWADAQPLVTA
jgi:hypothetical protein